MKSEVTACRAAQLVRLSLFVCPLIGGFLLGCGEHESRSSPTASPSSERAPCSVTQPVWTKPPTDSAIPEPPAYGYYIVNADRSIMASGWWLGNPHGHLRAGGDGVKVGWFRPTGATLKIEGRRLDAAAPPLVAHIPCCYPTRFQASGLVFPSAGCWRITARAADSYLSFVVEVGQVAEQSRRGAAPNAY